MKEKWKIDIRTMLKLTFSVTLGPFAAWSSALLPEQDTATTRPNKSASLIIVVDCRVRNNDEWLSNLTALLHRCVRFFFSCFVLLDNNSVRLYQFASEWQVTRRVPRLFALSLCRLCAKCQLPHVTMGESGVFLLFRFQLRARVEPRLARSHAPSPLEGQWDSNNIL